MGWKEEARRTIVGDKVDLKSFPGYWIRPRKYSMESMDEIRTIERKQQGEYNRKALARMAKKLSGQKGLSPEEIKELKPIDMVKDMDDEEFEALYQMVEAKHGFQAQLTSAKIKAGIAEHNFEGAEVEALSRDLPEYPSIAEEVVEIIDRYNVPLAKRRSGISEPSPDGSTKDESSSQTETTSRTDEAPGK